MQVAAELRALTTIAAAVTACTCLLLLAFVRFILRHSASKQHEGAQKSFHLQILIYCAWSEFIAAVSNLIYRVGEDSETFDAAGAVAGVARLCSAQGVLMQFGYLASAAWIGCLAINTYLHLFHLESHPKKFEAVYIFIAWILPAGDAILLSPLALDYVGPTDLWCWIDTRRHQLAQWVNFYLPIAVIFIIVLLLHTWSGRSLRARFYGGRFGRNPTPIMSSQHHHDGPHEVAITPGGVHTDGGNGLRRGAESLQATWRLYLTLYFLLRVPSIAHRAWETLQSSPRADTPEVDTDQIYILELLHAIASPLQGTLLLVFFIRNPRCRNAWSRWRSGNLNFAGSADAAHSVTISGRKAVNVNDGTYRSLSDNVNDSASRLAAAAALQQVFPPAILARQAPTLPPTQFKAFNLVTAQEAQRAPTASTNASDPGSLRIMSGTWNMGNEKPPVDLHHPSFDHPVNLLPTDASYRHLNQWLPTGDAANQFDVIAVGVQECEYDPMIFRSDRSHRWCGWRDPSNGIPSTETHWFRIVEDVVNHGRDGRTPPMTSGEVDKRPFRTVAVKSIGHIRLIVLVHPRHAEQVSNVCTSSEGSGLGNIHDNKGGCGISLHIGTRKLAFINVHLAALDGFAQDRNEDVIQILARMRLGMRIGAPSSGEGDIYDHGVSNRARASLYKVSPTECTCAVESDFTQSFDVMVFLGDLNYRLQVPTALMIKKKKDRKREAYAQATRAIGEGNLDFLRSCDELCQLLAGKKLFVGWNESLLQFNPTYKYRLPLRPTLKAQLVANAVTGTRHQDVSPTHTSAPSAPIDNTEATTDSIYDTKRTPAWCDRILLYTASSVHARIVEYKDVPGVTSSDHKPVCATMQVRFDGDAQDATDIDQHQHADGEECKSPSNGRTGPASSPRRRRRRSSFSSSSATPLDHTDPAIAAFVSEHPRAVEVLSPQSLSLLASSPASAAAAIAAAANEARSVYNIFFSQLTLYDAVDSYGYPISQPYITFLGSVLCSNSACCSSSPTGRPCIQSSTTIATSLTSNTDRDQLLRGPTDPFASSELALEANAIQCASWSADEIPDLVTAHRLTPNEIRSMHVQLLVKDAVTLGEVDTLGVARVDLAAGIIPTDQAEPIFFIAPILAQTKYVGFITGRYRVDRH